MTEGKLPVLWMSPESLFDGVSSTKSDVWSYGVLLWEIVTCGERPYTGVATEALLDLIKDGYRMSIPLQCPQNLYQIMKSCWFMKVRTSSLAFNACLLLVYIITYSSLSDTAMVSTSLSLASWSIPQYC